VAIAASSTDFNSYKASEAFCKAKPSYGSNSSTTASCSPSTNAAAGSKTKPVAMATHELWIASGNGGHKAAPIKDIVATVYGEQTDAKDFPVCTSAMINNNGNTKPPPHGWNAVCPKGSLIGGGPVTSLLMPPAHPTAGGSTCNPYLYIYNGGVQMYHGKPTQEQTFFFAEAPYAPAQYTCVGGAVKTGGAPAYPGYITPASSGNGNTWTMHIPLIPQVSTMAGGLPLYASLLRLNVVYSHSTEKKNGKTVAYGASIGCKAGQRPWSFTFTAQNYQGYSPPSQKTTVSGSDPC
jgi:hypothetical protein